MNKKPKILLYDIETAPILAYCWGLWDQNVALNQIHTDWYVISWSAKWLGEREVFYLDQRGKNDKENDKNLLLALWKLLDEADVVITQNGKQFDQKKINARFVAHGINPPKPYKHIDTLELAKKHFGFTSNKLAYMTDKLCTKYKKLTHHKFEGFELWKECLKDNKAAWKEMEKYNKHDVLSLEELYGKLAPWATSSPLLSEYGTLRCQCGSGDLEKRGPARLAAGLYQRYRCRKCGSWLRSGENLALKGSAKHILRKI